MADMISDLYVVLRAENTLMISGFQEAAAAGEAMEAKLAGVARTMDTQFLKLGESMAAVGAAADRMAMQVVTANERMAASSAAMAAANSAAAEKHVAATAAMSVGNDKLSAGMKKIPDDAKAAEAEISRWADSLLGPGIRAEESAIKHRMAVDKMHADTVRLSSGMETMAAKNIAAMEAQDAAIAKSVATTSAMSQSNLAMYSKIAAGVAVMGAAVMGVTGHMAANFEEAINRLYTGAGELKENLDMVGQGLLTMSSEVGVGATQLAQDMYMIESAGYHGAAGLGVLKAAEQGAKAEGADAAKVADALSSALRDYYPHATDAAQVTQAATTVMSKFVGATAAGKMSFEAMASSLHSVLPVAAAAGVSLDDILAALAAMTVHGYSADQATQNLAHAIGHLQTVTNDQAKTFAILGFSSQQIADDLSTKGLTGVVKELSDAIRSHMGPESTRVILDLEDALRKLPPAVQELGRKALDGSISWGQYMKAVKGLDVVSAGQAQSFATLAKSTHKIGQETLDGSQIMQTYSQTLKSAMGDQTGMNVALMLGGENAEYAADALKIVSGSTADAAGNVRGWNEVQSTFNQKWSEFKASLSSVAIILGTTFLPAMKKVVEVLTDGLKWLKEHPTILKIVAVALAVLTVAATAAAVALWAVNIALYANPIGLIVAGAILFAVASITLLVLAFHDIRNKIEQFSSSFETAWPKIKNFFSKIGDGISDVYHAVVNWFKSLPDKVSNAMSELGNAISDGFHSVINWFKELPGKIGNALSPLGKMIGDKAKSAWSSFSSAMTSAAEKVLSFMKDLPYKIGYAIGFLGGLLARKAADAGKAFLGGLMAIVKWVYELPGKIRQAAGDAKMWLYEHGLKAMRGLKDACVNGFNSVMAWLNSVPGKVTNFFSDAKNWLLDKGDKLITGLWDGIKQAWNDVAAWWDSLPSKIDNFLNGIGEWIKNDGQELIDGFWGGVKDIWNNVENWFSRVRDMIGNFFSDAGSWLASAGWSIVTGLWSGISSAGGWLMDQISGFAQGIIDGFKAGFDSHSPSRKMIVVGTYLMDGLAGGIDKNLNVALTSVKSATDKVVKHASVDGLGVSGSLKLAPGGTALATRAPAATHHQQVFNIHVQGNIRTTQQFVRDIQQEMLRYGIRNVGNGATYTGFGSA